MRTLNYWIIAIFFAASIFTGCTKDNPEPEPDPEVIVEPNSKIEASVTTKKVNDFVKDVMTDVYLWYNFLPAIDTRYETDSKAYFKKLLYSEDKWSYITDNITEFENSLQGIEKSFGYSLTFGRFVDANKVFTGSYFGIVEYVYPNTPASKAGFERGSLITQLNGESITAANYKQLLSGTSITVTKGTLTPTGISASGTISMTAEELNLDPVILYKIIEKNGHKIGYLFYAQFIANYNASLNKAFQYFKDNQITDLVLDLRYNPGGQTTAAQYLCSSIAPLATVNANSTLVSFQWNDKYQAYWISKNNQSQLKVPFDNTVPVKLGLSKLTVLTGPGSASASELTITGLEPYMEVIMVGDTTYGKYTASITLKPADWYENAALYTDIKNWGVQPIILRYANSLGVTNFKNGFAPRFLVADNLLPAAPLGDLADPLLKKAVENITGVTITALKNATVPVNYEVMDRGFSKFDPMKRNLQLDNIKDIPRL